MTVTWIIIDALVLLLRRYSFRAAIARRPVCITIADALNVV